MPLGAASRGTVSDLAALCPQCCQEISSVCFLISEVNLYVVELGEKKSDHSHVSKSDAGSHGCTYRTFCTYRTTSFGNFQITEGLRTLLLCGYEVGFVYLLRDISSVNVQGVSFGP